VPAAAKVGSPMRPPMVRVRGDRRGGVAHPTGGRGQVDGTWPCRRPTARPRRTAMAPTLRRVGMRHNLCSHLVQKVVPDRNQPN